ncbi:MAG: rod shape-determining protein MreC [Halanaerobiales bacterium]
MDFFEGKNSWLITLLIIIIVGGMGILNFMDISLPYLNWLQDGIYNIVSPVLEYFTYSYNQLSSFYYGVTNVGDIVEENRNLKKEVARLEHQINLMDESRRQDERLGNLNDFLDAFKEFTDYEATGASVIGYGPSNFEEMMIINKGSNDGLEEKMPVVSYNGTLVGRINETGTNSSQVMLINNPDFAVGGIVQDSRDIGIVKGQLEDRNINIMEKIPADSDIEEDDRILTSGLSNNFPKYLPIGRVVNVESDNFGISRKADIRLFFRDYTIEEVLIITDF